MTLAETAAVTLPSPLVATAWLADHMHQPGLKILDCTFRMPGVTPAAPEVYAEAHLPGAVFFDIDKVADHETSLPHMLPAPAVFEQAMAALGVGEGDAVVLYDTNGIMGAARVWWMLRAFGHDNTAILDGGLNAWRGEGRPVTPAIVTTPAARPFKARFDPGLVRNRDDIMAMVENGTSTRIVDARAAGRFAGAVQEPRPGLRAGHIPGSRNLDHATLVDPGSGKMKPPVEIVRLFVDAGVDVEKNLVASCGSGVTACVLAFGLYLSGHKNVAVYDGSWTEWGAPGPTPVAVGQ